MDVLFLLFSKLDYFISVGISEKNTYYHGSLMTCFIIILSGKIKSLRQR